MNNPPQAPPQPAPGPRETRIQGLWNDAWKAFDDGGVYEPLIAIAESELARFGANLPPGDAVAIADFERAQNVHLFQSRYFAAHSQKVESFREQTKWGVQQVYDQTDKFNQHAIRSLTLANGGVVIATLAYVQSKGDLSVNFIFVIGLCAIGYLLTILGSHVGVVLSNPVLQVMIELLVPRLSASERSKKLQILQNRSKVLMWSTRPIFYLSATCLIAALVIGVATLASERRIRPAPIVASALVKPPVAPSAQLSARGRSPAGTPASGPRARVCLVPSGEGCLR